MIAIHDALGRRIGEIATAYAVFRNYLMRAEGRIPEATVRFATDDSSIAATNALLGNAIVITSEDYPEPWVGYITRRSGTATEITLTCTGWESVLARRYLPDIMTINDAAGTAFRIIIDTANATQDTGIERGLIENHGPNIQGSYGSWPVLDALDDVTHRVGYEWQLVHSISQHEVLIEARFGPRIGSDNWHKTTLEVDHNCTYELWSEDAHARIFKAVVIGKRVDSTTLLGERRHAIRLVEGASGYIPQITYVAPIPPEDSTGTVRGTFGNASFSSSGPGSANFLGTSGGANYTIGEIYEAEPFVGRQSPARRGEQIIISDSLNAQESIDAAAESEIRKGRYSERTAVLRVHDKSVWPQCTIGSTVRLIAPALMFETGIDRPVRILGVEAREEEGYLRLLVEVVRRQKR